MENNSNLYSRANLLEDKEEIGLDGGILGWMLIVLFLVCLGKVYIR